MTTPPLLEIFFVNVGQGNCTLLKTYTEPTEYNCWIIDCGSVQFPDVVSGANKAYDPMSSLIVDLIGDCTSIYVLLSHADSDHFNIVFWVLKKIQEQNRLPRNTRVYIPNNSEPHDFLPSIPPETKKSKEEESKKNDTISYH